MIPKISQVSFRPRDGEFRLKPGPLILSHFLPTRQCYARPPLRFDGQGLLLHGNRFNEVAIRLLRTGGAIANEGCAHSPSHATSQSELGVSSSISEILRRLDYEASHN